MVDQHTMEPFSWNNLVSTVVGKLTPPSAEVQSSSDDVQEEGRGESNETTSSPDVEARDAEDTDTAQPTTCVGPNPKKCTPATAEEVKADIENTQVVMTEILKERNRKLQERVEQQNPHQAKCGGFTVSCNPANKEESKKPVMDRRDDALEFVFDLVEIALCGDRKTNIDERVAKKPTQKEQMPDPVQLLREKSIFQTLNPRSSKSKSKRRSSSNSEKEKETTDKDPKVAMPTIVEGKSKESTPVGSSTPNSKSEVNREKPKLSESILTAKDVTVTRPTVSQSVPSITKNEATSESEKPKSDDVKGVVPVVTVASTSIEDKKFLERKEQATPKESPKKSSKESLKESSKESRNEFPKKEAATKRKVQASLPMTSQSLEKLSKTDGQKSKKAEVQSQSHAELNKQEDFPPRVIHLAQSNDLPKKPKAANATYSPNLRQMRKGDKKVSSAVAAFNKKAPKANFGDSTRVVGQQARSTALAKPDKRPEMKVLEFLASLLSMGKNMESPRTPKGVVLLASVVSFLFWPEDLPRNKTMSSAPATPEADVPSLLSLVGDKKSGNRSSSPMKRRPPRPQLSTRRMSSNKKKSLNL